MESFATFSDASLPIWLMPALAIAVVILLGVIVGLLIKLYVATRSARRQADMINSPDPQMIMKEIEDTHARAAELIGIVQRWSGRLDDKMRRLDELLAQAETKLKRLQQYKARVVTSAPASRPENQKVKIEPKMSQNPIASPGAVEADPLPQAVYKLADAGQEPLEIARKLNEHVGKVELILALRKAGSAE